MQPSDPGALAVAFLGLIRASSARDPVLIAIDDVQWLDAASAALLSYVVRRLSTERVGVLLAQRDGTASTRRSPLATPVMTGWWCGSDP